MFIFLATNNSHKRKEIESYLTPLGIRCQTPEDLGFKEDVAETGASFSENALLKAQFFWNLLEQKTPVLSDDSGLCVDILKGRPGIYSARYGQTSEGNLPSHERNALLLKEIKETQEKTGDRSSLASGYFVTHLCLYLGPHCARTVEESLHGTLAPSTSGALEGFGYDPIFYPLGHSKSLAHLSTFEKNQISARGKALEQMAWILQSPTLLKSFPTEFSHERTL